MTVAIRVGDGCFDTWRAEYGNAIVAVYITGTTTLASLYSDETLVTPASNPIALLNRDIDGISYGKLSVPLYTGSAHYLSLDSGEQTGVIRPPLTTLDAIDASNATVIATGGSVARNLEDHVAQFIVAKNYGTISAAASAATNNATLVLAIAAAAALGGAEVYLPDGVLAYTNFTLSAGVILVGKGRGVTTLQSTYAGKTITISGDKAGFRYLTIDGSSLVASSIGVYSKAKNETVFDDVEVKRFVVGIQQQGAQRNNWQDLYIENCTTGVKCHGDNDASNGANGDVWRYNEWRGGRVTNCTTVGVELAEVDKRCWNNTIADVGFESNTGTALKLNGARHVEIFGCWWASNTTNLVIQDGTDVTYIGDNTALSIHFQGGGMTGGAVTFKDTLQDVLLDGMSLYAVAFTLTSPVNNVVFRDCVEDGLVTIAGDGTKLTRCHTELGDAPASNGVTTDATPTVGWSYALAPGELVNVEAIVTAVGRNVIDYSVFHIAQFARRPGSTLAYDAQTANFTVGLIVTGGTSGATGRILADADAGATGTLTLRSISGTFLDNELITDSSTGSATVNGTLSSQNAALLGSLTSIEAAVESDAATACVFTVSGTSVQVTVTGVAAKTYSWNINAKVTSGE